MSVEEEDFDMAYFKASKARHEERQAALRDAEDWKRRAFEAEAKALGFEVKIAKAIEAYKAGPLPFHEGFRTALAMYEILTGTERRSGPSAVNLTALRAIKDHTRNGGEF